MILQQVNLWTLSSVISSSLLYSCTIEGGEDYHIETMIPLIFTPTVSVHLLQVFIRDDNIHEDRETFFVVLSAHNQPVNISQERARITIVDDNDCTKCGCSYLA